MKKDGKTIEAAFALDPNGHATYLVGTEDYCTEKWWLTAPNTACV